MTIAKDLMHIAGYLRAAECNVGAVELKPWRVTRQLLELLSSYPKNLEDLQEKSYDLLGTRCTIEQELMITVRISNSTATSEDIHVIWFFVVANFILKSE